MMVMSSPLSMDQSMMEKHEKELRLNLYQFQMSGYLTDMVIMTRTGEVRAHRAAVLGLLPEGFKRLFLEGQNDDGSITLIVPDVTLDMVEDAMKSIYLMADTSVFIQLLEVNSLIHAKNEKPENAVECDVKMEETPPDASIDLSDDKQVKTEGRILRKKKRKVKKKEMEDFIDDDEDDDGSYHFDNDDSDHVKNEREDLKSLKQKCVSSEEVEGKTYFCDECSKSFSKWSYLRNHKKRHTADNEKLFFCTKCKRSYDNKDEFKEHKKSHHSKPKIKSHFCDQCPKAFYMVGDLKIHMRKHTGEKPFACHLCPKSFSQLPNLQGHVRRHIDDRPFSCDRCGQNFTHNKDLKHHILKHTGEKPFQCDECPKAFFEAGSLKKHKMTHSGEKPFLCPNCPKTFARAWNLEMHMRTHTGYKPNFCEICQKSFTRAWDLKTHMRTHNTAADGLSGSQRSDGISRQLMQQQVVNPVPAIRHSMTIRQDFVEHMTLDDGRKTVQNLERSDFIGNDLPLEDDRKNVLIDTPNVIINNRSIFCGHMPVVMEDDRKILSRIPVQLQEEERKILLSNVQIQEDERKLLLPRPSGFPIHITDDRKNMNILTVPVSLQEFRKEPTP